MVFGRILDSNRGVMRVYRRFDLPEEVQKRTVKGGRVIADLMSINLLEVMVMLMTAHVMIDMKGEGPRRRGEAVLMTAENEAAVTWLRRCRRGGEKQASVGALMTIMGTLEPSGGGGIFRQSMCGGWMIVWQMV